MRLRLATGTVVAFLGGLLAYEAVALAVSLLALGVALYALYRQGDLERRQQAIETGQLERAKQQGQQLGDELRGD